MALHTPTHPPTHTDTHTHTHKHTHRRTNTQCKSTLTQTLLLCGNTWFLIMERVINSSTTLSFGYNQAKLTAKWPSVSAPNSSLSQFTFTHTTTGTVSLHHLSFSQGMVEYFSAPLHWTLGMTSDVKCKAM